MVVGSEQLEDPGDFGEGAYRIDTGANGSNLHGCKCDPDGVDDGQSRSDHGYSQDRRRARLVAEAQHRLEVPELHITSNTMSLGRHRSTALWLHNGRAEYRFTALMVRSGARASVSSNIGSMVNKKDKQIFQDESKD